LSLRLFVDEDTQSERLVRLLRGAGHDVVTVGEAGLTGQDDATVLNQARREGRVLLTQNCDEFRTRHREDRLHAGIFVIYKSGNASKDMSRADIVKALGNLDASRLDFTGELIEVNAWQY
jgi:predicted nuclease of predicted toxin-antitoxin system